MQPCGNRFDRQRRLPAQPPLQRHLPRIAFAPPGQFFLAPTQARQLLGDYPLRPVGGAFPPQLARVMPADGRFTGRKRRFASAGKRVGLAAVARFLKKPAGNVLSDLTNALMAEPLIFSCILGMLGYC